MRGCRRLAAAVCVAAMAGPLSAAPEQAPGQAPRFGTAIDLIRLEVTVLDKRTRQPVRGLTADDFVVSVSGRPQVIEAFDEVTVVSRREHPSAFREAATDVATNVVEQPRLFLIVMDDVFAWPDRRGNDPFTRAAGRRIAHAVVDNMGPDDRAAVIFSEGNQHAQDFTGDRVALRRAIDTFSPKPVAVEMAPVLSLGVLERGNRFLRGMHGYRRAVVWVTLGLLGADLDDEDLMQWRPASDSPVDLAANAMADLVSSRAARVGLGGSVAPVPVYAYSLEGLRAVTSGEIRGGAMPNPFGNVALQRVSADTGGRVIHGTNAPDRAVTGMFDELSSYYTLAYRGDFPMDGKLRWLDVRVQGRDVIVAPSGTSFATPRTVNGEVVLPPRRDSVPALFEALAGPLPRGDVRLALSAVPLAVPGVREQMLALTVGFPPAETEGARQYALSLAVYDGEGRREILRRQQTVSLPPEPAGTDRTAEVIVSAALRPGRYAVRLAVQDTAAEAAGSVYTTVVVPDFARDPLAVSGVAVGRAEGRPIGGRDALADVLPFAPTTVRTFATTDRVGALLRVHQSARVPVDATVTTEVLDVGDEVVATATRTVPAAQFQPGVGVDHAYDLPLRQLSPGDYLLRFTVAAGKAQIHRDVRFTVRRP